MRCQETRRLKDAYLDSELDAKTSCEIDDHLQLCGCCAKYFQAEEAMENRIAGCLRESPSDEKLWRGIENQIASSQPFRVLARARTRPFWIASMAAAAAACLVIGFGVFRTAEASSVELAPEVARRHQAYLDGIVEPAFVCTKGQDIAGQCKGRLDEGAFAVLPGCPKFKTMGGRVCRIGDTPVAWTLASREGIPMSVIAFSRNELPKFPETMKRLAAAGKLVHCREGRFEVVIRAVDDYVIIAIAEAPGDLMEELVASAHRLALADGRS
jgi:hypothetical protein